MLEATFVKHTAAMDLGENGSRRYTYSEDPNGANSPFIKLRSFGQGKIVNMGRKQNGNLLPSDSHVLLFFLFNSAFNTGCCKVKEEYIYSWTGMRMQEVKASIKRLCEARCITKIEKINNITTFMLHPSFFATGKYDNYEEKLAIFNENSPFNPEMDLTSSRVPLPKKPYLDDDYCKELFSSRKTKSKEECIQELKEREENDRIRRELRARSAEIKAIRHSIETHSI